MASSNQGARRVVDDGNHLHVGHPNFSQGLVQHSNNVFANYSRTVEALCPAEKKGGGYKKGSLDQESHIESLLGHWEGKCEAEVELLGQWEFLDGEEVKDALRKKVEEVFARSKPQGFSNRVIRDDLVHHSTLLQSDQEHPKIGSSQVKAQVLA